MQDNDFLVTPEYVKTQERILLAAIGGGTLAWSIICGMIGYMVGSAG